jgi:hypothetical protein
VELKPPQVRPAESIGLYIYGRTFEFPGRLSYMHCVDRGSGEAALDTYLYRTAVEEGVEFEFGRELRAGDATRLPPRSIIATGLFHGPFADLGIPCIEIHGFVGRGRREGPPRLGGWFDTGSKDYSYYASTNGIAFGLCFTRGPFPPALKEAWERRLVEEEGLEFAAWDEHEGAVAVRRWNNPRLFWGDKILAGSLAGVQDPFTLFGVHGALVSGRIAAVAVDDAVAAREMFRRFTTSYKYSFAAKRCFDLLPHPARKRVMGSGLGIWLSRQERMGFIMDAMLRMVPGFKKV